MKKILVFIAFGFLIFSESSAQKNSLGPVAGVNVSSFRNAANEGSQPGFKAGIFWLYSIREHFGIGASLLYSAEGGKYSERTMSGGVTTLTKYTTTLNYIRVPLQAGIFFNQLGDPFRPKITIGPSFGFLAGAENEITASVTNNGASSSQSTDKSMDLYRGFDLSALITAGFNLRLSENVWLNLDLGYAAGLTNVRKNIPANEEHIQNDCLSATLGIGFGIGRGTDAAGR